VRNSDSRNPDRLNDADCRQCPPGIGLIRVINVDNFL
jgi:hypothetical protein